MSQLSNISPDSPIYYISFTQDVEGNHYSPEDSLIGISSTPQASIFGPRESYIQRGIVGGYLFIPGKFEIEIGSLALQSLSGTLLVSQKIDPEKVSTYKFDWIELCRFGIDLSRIPKSILVGKEESVWIKYSLPIIVILIIIASETLFNAGLVINRRSDRIYQGV